jgi:hypothetical protein
MRSLAPRSLATGPIVGISIGTFFGVGILLFCLYPFVRCLLNKWRGRKTGKEFDPSVDIETAGAPEAVAPIAPGPEARRLSSRDSFATKPGDLRPERQSSKELNTAAFDGVQYGVINGFGHGGVRPTRPHRIDSIDRGYEPMNVDVSVPRRESGFSLGPMHSTQSSQLPQSPPPESIDYDLNVTESHGYNDSYYHPSGPIDDLSMITPPQAEPVPVVDPVRRSSSKASSLKFNMLAMLGKRRSSRDSRRGIAALVTAQPVIAVVDPTLAGSPQLSIPLPGLVTAAASAPHQVISEEVSESPVSIAPSSSFPTDSAKPPKAAMTPAPADLASPIALPHSPETALSLAPMEVLEAEVGEGDTEPQLDLRKIKLEGSPSPPILPPSQPAPGTADPMAIMQPSNPSELKHYNERQLYQISNSPPMVDMAAFPANGDFDFGPAQTTEENSSSKQPEVGNIQDFMFDNQSLPNGMMPGQVASNQDVHMTDLPFYGNEVPVPSNMWQLNAMYQEGERGGPSAHSSPYPGNNSSGPSTHDSPETRNTEISPSPRSLGSPDGMNGVSPLPVQALSPQSLQAFKCDECGRIFDQIHKLK